MQLSFAIGKKIIKADVMENSRVHLNNRSFRNSFCSPSTTTLLNVQQYNMMESLVNLTEKDLESHSYILRPKVGEQCGRGDVTGKGRDTEMRGIH